MAEGVLPHNALGVGEDHRKPDARNFTIWLIQHGLAKVVFLEVYHWFQAGVSGKMAQPVDAPDYSLKVDGAFPGEGFQNSTSLGELAGFAGRYGAQVYLIDEKDRRWNPASAEGAWNRDQFAAERFYGVVRARGSRANCLVLYGARHFDGTLHRPCLGDMLCLDYVLFT